MPSLVPTATRAHASDRRSTRWPAGSPNGIGRFGRSSPAWPLSYPVRRRAWRSRCARPWPECTWNGAGLPTRCESSTPPAASSRSARTFTCFAGSCSTRQPDPPTPAKRFAPRSALDASDPITAYHVFRHAATAGNTKEMQGAREILAAAYLRLLQDGARAKAFPFVGIELLQDSAASAPVLAPVAYRRAYGHLANGNYDRGDRRIPKGRGDRSPGHRSGVTIGVDDAGGRRAQAGTPGGSAFASRRRRCAAGFARSASRARPDLLGGLSGRQEHRGARDRHSREPA